MRIIALLLLVTSSYAQSVGTVVGWKFDHAPGISTLGNEITEWPAALGPKPTRAQIKEWSVQYKAEMDAKEAEDAIDMDCKETCRTLESLTAVLIAKGVLSREEVPPIVLERINRRRARRSQPPL